MPFAMLFPPTVTALPFDCTYYTLPQIQYQQTEAQYEAERQRRERQRVQKELKKEQKAEKKRQRRERNKERLGTVAETAMAALTIFVAGFTQFSTTFPMPTLPTQSGNYAAGGARMGGCSVTWSTCTSASQSPATTTNSAASQSKKKKMPSHDGYSEKRKLFSFTSKRFSPTSNRPPTPFPGFIAQDVSPPSTSSSAESDETVVPHAKKDVNSLRWTLRACLNRSKKKRDITPTHIYPITTVTGSLLTPTTVSSAPSMTEFAEIQPRDSMVSGDWERFSTVTSETMITEDKTWSNRSPMYPHRHVAGMAFGRESDATLVEVK